MENPAIFRAEVKLSEIFDYEAQKEGAQLVITAEGKIIRCTWGHR